MAESFDSWAIVEVMGHQTFAGKVSEQTVGGASFVRIDIPDTTEQPGFTKLFGGGSIYCITPCAEDIARLTAARVRSRPVQVFDLPPEWRDKISRPALNGPTDGEDDLDDNY